MRNCKIWHIVIALSIATSIIFMFLILFKLVETAQATLEVSQSTLEVSQATLEVSQQTNEILSKLKFEEIIDE